MSIENTPFENEDLEINNQPEATTSEVEIAEIPEPEEVCSCGCCSDAEKPKKKFALSKSELFKVIICIILVATSIANTAILLFTLPSSARTTLDMQKNLEAYGKRVASKCIDISDLELVPSTGQYGGDCIIANVENTSKKKLCNINITFRLYDEDEKLLTTKTVYIEELDAGKTEEIAEDVYSGEEIFGISVQSITAFYYSDLHTK